MKLTRREIVVWTAALVLDALALLAALWFVKIPP